MANIAKFQVTDVQRDGGGLPIIYLSTVYESDMDGGDCEDVRFTKATPYGQMTIYVTDVDVVCEGLLDKNAYGQHTGLLYMLVSEKDDTPNLDKADFTLPAQCQSITDFGYTKSMDLQPISHSHPMWEESDRVIGGRFEGRLGIDNPVASVQFKPMEAYWLSFFDANKMSLEEALSAARG
jgi:hypothetical protein